MILEKASIDKYKKNRNIINFITGFAMGIFLSYKFLFLVCANKDRRISMFSEYFYTLDKWMKLNKNQYWVSDYLLKKGYRNIAIYGVGVMGKQLISDLQGGDIQIRYAIDRKGGKYSYQFPVITINDKLENIDAIIVTPSYEFNKIKGSLEGKVFCPIISLRQLIEEWYETCNK